MTRTDAPFPVPARVKVNGLETPWRGGWWSHKAGLEARDNPHLTDPWKTAWLEGWNAHRDAGGQQ